MRPRAEIAGELPRDWASLSSYTARCDAISSAGATAPAWRKPRPPIKTAPMATTADKQTTDLPEIVMAICLRAAPPRCNIGVRLATRNGNTLESSRILVPRTRSSRISCREFDRELRVQRGTRIIELLVVLDSEVRKRGCRTNDANFGIGPLAGVAHEFGNWALRAWRPKTETLPQNVMACARSAFRLS